MIDIKTKSKITDLLNQTGAPFQDWCTSIVDQSEGYTFVTEYPYTWPLDANGTPGTIDIVATSFDEKKGYDPFRDGVIYLIVECKRANSEIKNWVFPFVKEEQREYSFFLGRSFPGGSEKPGFRDVLENEVTFPRLAFSMQREFDAVTQGFELNEAFTTINRNKQEIIYKYLHQVNMGLAAFAATPHAVSGLYLPEHTKALYSPVLVTTAKLYIAKYNPTEVEISSGTITSDKVEYEERPWLTYQFPLPFYLSYFNGKLEKMPTFIVQANAWKNFLKFVRVVYGAKC